METKRVRDLMLPLAEYATITDDATVRQALVALSKAQMGLTYDRHHHRAVLVLDSAGNVVGKLTYLAILASLEPKLLHREDEEMLARSNLNEELLGSLRSRLAQIPANLRVLCRGAARVKVREAMVPVRESIDADAPLAVAIRMMVLGHWQSVLVTQGARVTGILRLADVFEEVADMIRSTDEEC